MTAASAVLALSLAACGGEGAGGGGTTRTPTRRTSSIGVSMPTQTSERWIADGNAVKEQLEAEGYEVELQYANDDIPTQSQQVDQMITQGVDALIIAAIDGTALSSQLQAAADAGIPVISYDRLIRDSENVDFYVSFDNFKVGVAQANALLTGLGITNEDGAARHRHRAVQRRAVRRFAGRQQRPLLLRRRHVGPPAPHRRRHAGREVRPDRHRAGRHAALAAGDRAEAHGGPADRQLQRRHPVDGVLSPYDGLSRGIITALQNAGYGHVAAPSPMPIVTGQDAEIASVKLINDGVQSSTIFKDTRLLAEQAVIAAKAFLEGNEPEANDTETYDNGVKVVPSYLLPVETVFKDDIQSVADRLGLLDGRRGRRRPGRLTARTQTGRARWRHAAGPGRTTRTTRRTGTLLTAGAAAPRRPLSPLHAARTRTVPCA